MFVRYVIIEVPSIYSCDPEINLSLSTFDGDDQLLTLSLWYARRSVRRALTCGRSRS